MLLTCGLFDLNNALNLFTNIIARITNFLTDFLVFLVSDLHMQAFIILI